MSNLIEEISRIDTNIFLYLNSLHSPVMDTVMWWISYKLTWIPLYLLIIYFISKKLKWKALITVGFLILLITLSDQISYHFFKESIQRLRPCHNPMISDIVHLVKNHCGGKYGFVSSHASNSFALAIFTILFFKNRNYLIFILIWATVVSYSRIYLGVHYPGDVICGAVLGSLLGIIVYYLYFRFMNKYHKTLQ